MALLLDGGGLRLVEWGRLRLKDLHFARNQVVVRSGKGNIVRLAPLPALVRAALARHLGAAKAQHDLNLRDGAGWLELPWAPARRYPSAGRTHLLEDRHDIPSSRRSAATMTSARR